MEFPRDMYKSVGFSRGRRKAPEGWSSFSALNSCHVFTSGKTPRVQIAPQNHLLGVPWLPDTGNGLGNGQLSGTGREWGGTLPGATDVKNNHID